MGSLPNTSYISYDNVALKAIKRDLDRIPRLSSGKKIECIEAIFDLSNAELNELLMKFFKIARNYDGSPYDHDQFKTISLSFQQALREFWVRETRQKIKVGGQVQNAKPRTIEVYKTLQSQRFYSKLL